MQTAETLMTVDTWMSLVSSIARNLKLAVDPDYYHFMVVFNSLIQLDLISDEVAQSLGVPETLLAPITALQQRVRVLTNRPYTDGEVTDAILTFVKSFDEAYEQYRLLTR